MNAEKKLRLLEVIYGYSWKAPIQSFLSNFLARSCAEVLIKTYPVLLMRPRTKYSMITAMVFFANSRTFYQ